MSHLVSSTIECSDGTRLRCFTAGEGPTVVLAHGYLDEHKTFDDVVPLLLAAGRRVITFDQRAHGGTNVGRDGLSPRSMASDYRAVIEHFDVKDGVLLGHSMGAFLTVVFAILHADVAHRHLRGLVLVGGHAGEVARGSVQNQVQIKLVELGAMTLISRSRRASRAMARTLFGDVAEPRHIELTAETFRRADKKATLPILAAQVEESYYDRLGEITVPAIVVCGERDRTCPRRHSERLGARIPGSRNVWLPRIGHMVPYEAPSAIIDAIEDQLRRPMTRTEAVPSPATS
jgi:pimeloyl-ACP methyl ester carboxylesterase